MLEWECFVSSYQGRNCEKSFVHDKNLHKLYRGVGWGFMGATRNACNSRRKNKPQFQSRDWCVVSVKSSRIFGFIECNKSVKISRVVVWVVNGKSSGFITFYQMRIVVEFRIILWGVHGKSCGNSFVGYGWLVCWEKHWLVDSSCWGRTEKKINTLRIMIKLEMLCI